MHIKIICKSLSRRVKKMGSFGKRLAQVGNSKFDTYIQVFAPVDIICYSTGSFVVVVADFKSVTN